jgi:hypothetical protein
MEARYGGCRELALDLMRSSLRYAVTGTSFATAAVFGTDDQNKSLEGPQR